jgi:pimeloyl-ACP methyl ester carboxylesterase
VVSLRHFFPAHWDGAGDDYLISQHVADLIGFIEQISPHPVDLMGHSRGGHIAFRAAVQRPELVRRLVLAEPGGELDASLEAASGTRPASPLSRVAASAAMIRAGDIEGALENFYEGIEGEGTWARLPAAAKQQLRDNVFTLLGQVGENRKPYTRADVLAVRTPTLFIGGGETKGSLAHVHRALAPHVAGAKTAVIPGAGHWMFDQAPQDYCAAVLEFLAGAA